MATSVWLGREAAPAAACPVISAAAEQSLLSPPNPVLAQVREKLGSELAGLDPALQVDVVWALCVLQQVREAELRAVLRPEFHTQFLGEQWGDIAPPPK